MSLPTTVAGIAMGLLLLGVAGALTYAKYLEFKEKQDAKREDWRSKRKRKLDGWETIHKKLEVK